MNLRSEPYHYYVFVFLRSAVSSPLLVPPSTMSASSECSVSKCSENFCESRGRHSPQTSPWCRYKLERNYYYRPSPISPPTLLLLLHFLPHTPRVSCCRVFFFLFFWRFRTVSKDLAVKSVFPTSAICIFRQHNPETILAKITRT